MKTLVLLITAATTRMLAFSEDAPKPFDPAKGHTNGLGMRFVPLQPQDATVLFSIYETRVKDFRAFVRETGYVHTREKANSFSRMWSLDKDGDKQRGYSWENPGFAQTEDHPVVGVSWNDAMAFCEWLTLRERAARRLPGNWKYRLPTDHEWSVAVGLKEDPNKSPWEKDTKILEYPWGKNSQGRLPRHLGNYPVPPTGFGNYAGGEIDYRHFPEIVTIIADYNDGYVRTAPVGSFKPNRFGIYDLSGNVWELCQDQYAPLNEQRVKRGSSWMESSALLSSFRLRMHSDLRDDRTGFRCVAGISSRDR